MPGRAFRIAVCFAVFPLLQSCAAMGGKKGEISKGQIEIIREEYQIDEIGQDHYVHYKGTVKHWGVKDVYAVTAVFIGFDKDKKPVVNFKRPLADKLVAGAEQNFEFRSAVEGVSFERFGSQIRYLDKKPSLLDSFILPQLREK